MLFPVPPAAPVQFSIKMQPCSMRSMIFFPAGCPCVVSTFHSPTQKSNCLYSDANSHGLVVLSASATDSLNRASSRRLARSASVCSCLEPKKPELIDLFSHSNALFLFFNL